LRGKRIGPEEYRYCVSLRLKKIEWQIIKALADTHGGKTGTRVRSVPQAVAALLRIALHCLASHTDRYQDPDPLSERQAAELGLRPFKGLRGHSRIKSARHARARYTTPDPEDQDA